MTPVPSLLSESIAHFMIEFAGYFGFAIELRRMSLAQFSTSTITAVLRSEHGCNRVLNEGEAVTQAGRWNGLRAAQGFGRGGNAPPEGWD